MDRMSQMLDMQAALQRRYHDGRDPASFSIEDRCSYIQVMVHAAQHELGEAMDEVGWKPWASSRHINRAQFHAEMVDAWHFFMNLMLAGDMDMDDLYRGYMEKNPINHTRITDGYDGVSTKCKCCGRALDDPATECTANGCADPCDEQDEAPDVLPPTRRAWDLRRVRAEYAGVGVNPGAYVNQARTDDHHVHVGGERVA